MSLSLACDGLPNCGETAIPNSDEQCFKVTRAITFILCSPSIIVMCTYNPQIHWSSVLLSLVSYILLAITMLLCMSCFARILIQVTSPPHVLDL